MRKPVLFQLLWSGVSFATFGEKIADPLNKESWSINSPQEVALGFSWDIWKHTSDGAKGKNDLPSHPLSPMASPVPSC